METATSIDHKELMIDNWVLSENGEPFQWSGDDFSRDYFTIAYPIPLTPEILEKAGFEKVTAPNAERNSFVRWIPFHDGFWLHYIETYHGENFVVCENLKTPDSVVFHYVHQLQNLYFALTGEELKIEL